MLRKTFNATAAAAALALSLSACGGGGGTSALPTTSAPTNPNPTQNQSAKASMTIKIPAKAANAKSQYISASTQSMTIGIVNGGKTTQIAEVDLTSTSPSCTPLAGGGLQCNVTFVGSAGTNTYALSMYDQTGGKGNLLSSGNVAATLTTGQNTNVPITLDGVPASSSVVLGTATLPVGSAGATSVTVMAKDSGGNIIVGPGGFTTPITLAISGDTYRTLSLSSTSITQPGQVVTLNYSGGSNIGSTITPSIGSTSGTGASFNATGAVLTEVQWNDPADNFSYNYTYGIQPIPNTKTAAVLMEPEQCCWSTTYAIGIVSKSGMQSVYTGDTSDPYNIPAPGSLTYTGMTVVHGMSSRLITWEGDAVDKELAVDANGKIYYGAYFGSTSAPNCVGGVIRTGVLGVLTPGASPTTVERPLKGYPMYMQLDPSGNLWFVEDSGSCSTTGSLLTSGYAVGELTPSGALTETEFSSFGMGNMYPDAMALNSTGSMMYIAEGNNPGGIDQIPLPSLSTSVNATPQYSTYANAFAIAPDNTMAWFSNEEPGDYYYWGYLPGTKSFTAQSMVDALFPITYYYSYGMTYGDGSFWSSGYEYGTGIGRYSNVASGSPVVGYYAMPYPDGEGQYMTGMAVGNGYVWGGDDEYGNIDILEYGAPSTGTVTYNAKQHMGMVLTQKNPNPGPQHHSLMTARHTTYRKH